jgi:CDP-6-deoxy-D-xylo-4-hexulose-3-dehydrase
MNKMFKKLNWKLNESNFTLLDKLKISSFIFSNNFWTMGEYVKEFENKMAKFVGSKHSVFVSSGSTANTILAYYLKDKFYSLEKNIIIFPSTTWTTSVGPFIREGFVPKFIDISLTDLCMDLDKLENFLIENTNKVSCIFYTSLLGYVPDINRLIDISKKYNVKVMMDNCENTLGEYLNKNISSYFTSTTSTYFGHQLQSVEGGFIFTNDDTEYDYFLMYRNHGMTRSVTNNEQYLNRDVDSKFDFYLTGNNFRNTNIHAFIGLLDFERKNLYKAKRIQLYNLFKNTINNDNLIFPNNSSIDKLDVPFSIPLIFKDVDKKNMVRELCDNLSIETRPIISGNLLKQTCFKAFDDYRNFPVSEYLHNFGFYIGLHSKVKETDIQYLTEQINGIL